MPVRKLLLVPVCLLLCAASFAGYGVKLSFFDVTPDGRAFTIRWQMEVEEQVHGYELTRRTPFSNDQFVLVHAFRPQGPGLPYEFRDEQVYKSAAEQVDYRLEAVYSNGLREVVVTRSLNYTTTAVRRTWGSIKAMFQ